jgi:tyrosyl-tRNA synthetase
VQADVEMGGTDQTFNLLMGRDIQTAYGQPEQVILTTPIINGVDGRKMSKSYGNQIGVADAPAEMFGRTMRIADEQLEEWYTVLLGEPVPEALGPRDAKRALARALVDRFHGAGAGQEAEAAFDRVFVQGGEPDEVPEVRVSANGDGMVHLPALIAETFGGSRSDARRAIAQGGVKLDGEPISSDVLDLPVGQLDGVLLQVGKRRFARLRAAG